ncbi:MAG: cbb3-type cytochrome c oxidase subunit I [Phycisphaerae bacterium]|nr:cbb3-type cytochrome c oxidase subunit I [Phycisphaerae bacterium]
MGRGTEERGRRSGPPPGVRSTVACLLWTLATGVVLGVKSARPALGVETVPMQVLQPLHTLGVMCFLFCGTITLASMAIRRASGRYPRTAGAATAGMTAFFALAGGAIAAGKGSGLEYVPWPIALTAVPVLALVATACAAWRHLGGLSAISAEGSWLLLMGLCLAPLGLLERAAGSGAMGPARALMIEWHALDMVFAGVNTALYGLGTLLSAPAGRGRALRGRWLYALAVLALLSTFGHHHYLSPQPLALKVIAFGASMLGLLSFLRHVAMVRRSLAAPAGGAGAPLLLAASLWTLFAVGSGVLLAIPQLNLVLHGTHAIVGHSMGAIIGVNVAIVLGGLLGERRAGEAPRPAGPIRSAAWLFNAALALMVLDLLAAGLVKGVVRVGDTHHAYQPLVRSILAPLPVLGLVLAGATVRLSVLALRRPSMLGRTTATAEPATERTIELAAPVESA